MFVSVAERIDADFVLKQTAMEVVGDAGIVEAVATAESVGIVAFRRWHWWMV